MPEQSSLTFDLPPAPPDPITGEKLDRELMLQFAQRYLHLLAPVCSRITIAGSIRRLKPLVKDIEIVAIEKSPGACFEVLSDYRSSTRTTPVDFWVRKGPRYLQFRDRRNFPPALAGGLRGDSDSSFILHPSSFLRVPVDLFLSQEDYWGWTLFIRTGEGREWNRACMQRLHDLGFKVEHNRLYRVGKGSSLIPHPSSLASEEDVFNVLGIPFLEPHLRTDAHSLSRALFQAGLRSE